MDEKYNNPYEHLLVRDYDEEDLDLKGAVKRVSVFDTPGETITVFLQDDGAGHWTYGYNIYFSNGRSATRKPNLEYGYCVTENDALLHFLGLCLSFRTSFSEDAVAAIKAMIMDRAQLKLF